MSSADRNNLPPDGDTSQAEPASDAASATSSEPPTNLSHTLRTGSAFKSTWRMPSLRPVSADPAQSGVRRLDLDLPSPKSGRTLHDLFSGPPPAPTASSSAPARPEHSPRSGVTLTNLPGAPPPGAPRGDWLPSVPVGPRLGNGAESGRRNRITDPMGSTRLSPADLRPQPAAPRSQPARAPSEHIVIIDSESAAVAPPAAPEASRHRSDPVSAERSVRPEPVRQPLPWGLITGSVVLIGGLVGFAYWRNLEPARDPNVNVVLPLVQAPAEAEPSRTSIRVSERTAVQPEETQAAATRARPPAAEAPAAPETLVESVPPGAEIVLRGAVIANTPAYVPLPPYGDEYLLRKAGYLPELVRIEPASPERIQVQLKPAAE